MKITGVTFCTALILSAICGSPLWAGDPGDDPDCCCAQFGLCLPIVDGEECLGNILCPPDNVGACCLGDSCAEPVGGDACTTSGGTYLGDDSTCGDGTGCDFPDLILPCCLNGECTETTAGDCAALGGQSIGIGNPGGGCDVVNCGGVDPPAFGACCANAGCLGVVTEDACAGVGGTFLEDQQDCGPECGNIPLPTIECCCLDGQCLQIGTQECEQMGGTAVEEVSTNPIGLCRCETGGVAVCDTPSVVHPPNTLPIVDVKEPAEETDPPDTLTIPITGYIDPRAESTDGKQLDVGIQAAIIAFDRPVYGSRFGEPVTTENFSMEQTGEQTPPTVVAVEVIDPQQILVEWDRPLSLKQWTTIKADVFSAFGSRISNLGNLGAGINEPDRIDIGFLPGDLDQNGTVTPNDLFRFRQGVNGLWEPGFGMIEDFLDIDRNGAIQPLDLFRLRQIINGNGVATQPWSGESMTTDQP